jgi:hypothetical protein
MQVFFPTVTAMEVSAVTIVIAGNYKLKS